MAIEYRWAENTKARLPALVDDLIRRRVAVIAANGTPSVLAAKAATRTIPIVFMTGGDPVEQGFVASLPRPGGNLTGVTLRNKEVSTKLLEFMHRLLPGEATLAFLRNPTSQVQEAQTIQLQVAARTLGVRLLVVNASDPSEFEAAFATIVRERAGGLVVGGDAMLIIARDQLFAYAARHALPTISYYRELAEIALAARRTWCRELARARCFERPISIAANFWTKCPKKARHRTRPIDQKRTALSDCASRGVRVSSS